MDSRTDKEPLFFSDVLKLFVCSKCRFVVVSLEHKKVDTRIFFGAKTMPVGRKHVLRIRSGPTEAIVNDTCGTKSEGFPIVSTETSQYKQAERSWLTILSMEACHCPAVEMGVSEPLPPSTENVHRITSQTQDINFPPTATQSHSEVMIYLVGNPDVNVSNECQVTVISRNADVHTRYTQTHTYTKDSRQPHRNPSASSASA